MEFYIEQEPIESVTFDDPNVFPCVGNGAYRPIPQGYLCSLSFSKGKMVEFAKTLADYAVACGKKHIVILSSLDFGRWQTVDMSSGLQINYLSSTNIDGVDDDCERLGWKRLQDYDPTQRLWKHLSALVETEGAKGLKVTCLLRYCSEGDNIPEAFRLADAVSNLTGLNPDKFQDNEDGKWVVPFSWQSVYGPPPDMSLF